MSDLCFDYPAYASIVATLETGSTFLDTKYHFESRTRVGRYGMLKEKYRSIMGEQEMSPLNIERAFYDETVSILAYLKTKNIHPSFKIVYYVYKHGYDSLLEKLAYIDKREKEIML